MDTDIVCDVEAGLETIPVLSGVKRREEVARYPYRPSLIVKSLTEIEV